MSFRRTIAAALFVSLLAHSPVAHAETAPSSNGFADAIQFWSTIVASIDSLARELATAFVPHQSILTDSSNPTDSQDLNAPPVAATAFTAAVADAIANTATSSQTVSTTTSDQTMISTFVKSPVLSAAAWQPTTNSVIIKSAPFTSPASGNSAPSVSEQYQFEALSNRLSNLTAIVGNVASLLPSLAQNQNSATAQQFLGDGNPEAIGAGPAIDQLSNVTITNPSITGLSAGDIPNLSGSYLSLNGGTLTGAFADSATASSSFTGALGIGTTSPSDVLAVDGPIYLANVTPAATTNRLYSNAGSLYWAGSPIAGGSVGNWTTDGTNVWRTGGNVGIGTSSPGALLSANGNILGNGTLALTGTTGTSTIAAGQGFTIGTNQFIVQQGSGNIGIATSSPFVALSVVGNGYLAGALTAANYFGTTSSTTVLATGATTPRPLGDIAADIVNVKSFGAKGNGVTDDTTAIQNAMTYASTTDNGAATVYFPAGTYEVSAPIVVNSSVQLDPSAIIQATLPMAAVIEMGYGGINGLDNATFEGGTVDSNNKASDGLFLRQFEHVSVRNVTVNNLLVDGFHFADATLSGNKVEVIADNLHTIRTSGSITPGSASVLFDQTGSDNVLTNSVFTASDIGVDVKSAGNWFDNVHVYAWPPADGQMTIGFKDEGFQNEWSHCYADSATLYGMYVNGDDPTITDCRFSTAAGWNSNNTVYAIYFPSSVSSSPPATVTDTSFDGASGANFITDIAASSTANMLISGNNVGNVTSPISLGIDTTGSITIDGTTGTSTIASGQGFTVGGSKFVVQQGSGDIGIGLSNPNVPLVLFNSTDALMRFFAGSQNGLYIDNWIGGSTINEDDNAPLTFNTNDIERMRITGGGNLGIGTTSPGSLLSLNSIANFTTATSTFYSTGGINLGAGCFAIGGDCLTLSSIGGTINLASQVSGVLPVTNGGTGMTTWQTNSIPYYNGTTFTENNANFNFNGTTLTAPLLSASQASGTSTIASGQGFTVGGSKFVVQQGSGDIGIGLSNPNVPLVLFNSTDALMRFFAGSQNGLYIDNWIGGSTINEDDNAPLTFNTNDIERMRITGGGNLGIGTTSPYSRLEVWGPDTASTTAFLVANSASTTEFAVYDTGNATLAGGLTQNSDQRLKTNIQSINGSSTLAAIDNLNPVTFSWIDPNQGTTPQLGFIAQQVQSIFPNLVSTTSPTALTPNGTLSLNYIGLISPIISAIQALSAEITSLETTIAGFAQSITSAVGNFGQVNSQRANTQELCVGSTCINQQQLAAVLASANQSGTSPDSSSDSSSAQPGATASSSSDSSATPPVVQVNGDNPATVQVGATYTDLGAQITGPQQDLNLGIQTFVNGTAMSPVQINTSAAATDTIAYVVTDQSGLTSTTTRAVIVEGPSIVPPTQ